jgi:hypothetical protein
MTIDENPDVAERSPRRWIAVIYAVLALTAFAFPGGLTSWLEDRNVNNRLWLPLIVARQVEAASNAIGVGRVGVELRRRFSELIGGDDS